jgi:predicted metal-dependent hydrolase
MEIPYKIEHRKVKYPRLEFRGLQLLVILPQEKQDPSEILTKRKEWIQRRWEIIQEAVKKSPVPGDFMIFGEIYKIQNTSAGDPFINFAEKKILLDFKNPRHLKTVLNQLRKILKKKVEAIIEEYAGKCGYKPNKIYIRKQQTKWGSCSGKRNITLNLKLVCLPEQVIKYVVFHELTHLFYRRHNKKFWNAIGRKYPNYKEHEQKLLEYWFTTELFFKNLKNRQTDRFKK